MKLKRHKNFLNENLEKSQYEIGNRIEIIEMNDIQAVQKGTQGTIIHIDGIGQLHVEWDNGRTLAVIPGEDEFKIID